MGVCGRTGREGRLDCVGRAGRRNGLAAQTTSVRCSIASWRVGWEDPRGRTATAVCRVTGDARRLPRPMRAQGADTEMRARRGTARARARAARETAPAQRWCDTRCIPARVRSPPAHTRASPAPRVSGPTHERSSGSAAAQQRAAQRDEVMSFAANFFGPAEHELRLCNSAGQASGSRAPPQRVCGAVLRLG